MGDPPLRAVGLGLLSCLAAACSTSSMAAPPTRADAAIEAAVDAPPELPDCGEEFIAIEVDREGGALALVLAIDLGPSRGGRFELRPRVHFG